MSRPVTTADLQRIQQELKRNSDAINMDAENLKVDGRVPAEQHELWMLYKIQSNTLMVVANSVLFGMVGCDVEDLPIG